MSIQCPTFTRVLRLRLKDKHARALREHAYWVNQVWNYCNELSFKVLQHERRLLSGFDLQKYTAGATREGLPLHSQTMQAIAEEYALRRKQFKKTKLRWRVSNPKSSKYSLGWIPFKASALRYRSGQVHFSGLGPLSLWDSYGLSNFELGPGSFSEDARGRWYLNVTVKVPLAPTASSNSVVGIDLGLKTAATTSDGAKLEAKHYHELEAKLAVAQRARKKARVAAIHAKIRNRRKEALHQFTTALVNDYGAIFIGDVSTAWQAATGNGKSVLDASWGQLKTQLQYKGERAGRWVEVVDEAYSTQACSTCGERTGPKGRDGLANREWTCSCCGAVHDRDVNAAKNIAAWGLLGVEARVSAVRLERDANQAKALERKTKLAVNKAAKVAAAGHGRPVEGIPVLSRVSGQPLG